MDDENLCHHIRRNRRRFISPNIKNRLCNKFSYPFGILFHYIIYTANRKKISSHHLLVGNIGNKHSRYYHVRLYGQNTGLGLCYRFTNISNIISGNAFCMEAYRKVIISNKYQIHPGRIILLDSNSLF